MNLTDVYPILVIIWLHFIGDFFFQTTWMAQNKSSRWDALGIHIVTYSLLFFWIGWKYAVVNAVLHGITDAITSRINKKLWEENRLSDFFLVVGFDQAIHLTTLILTYIWLV